MEILTQIAASLASDPEVQEMIVDGIMYLLGACGVSGVWLIKARTAMNRMVPIMVTKMIAARVDYYLRRADISEVTIGAQSLVNDVVDGMYNVLPKGAMNIPGATLVVEGLANAALSKIAYGNSPLTSTKRLSGQLGLKADMKKIGADFDMGIGNSVSLGANTSVDLKTQNVNWGANVKIRF